MASVVNDPSGFRRIQWRDNGDCRTLRLGKVSLLQANAIKVRIEQVLASRRTGVLDTEAARWLEHLDGDMHERLARLGLVKLRSKSANTLGKLLDAYFETLNIKQSTKTTYLQTRRTLEDHFGASAPLQYIDALGAERWRKVMVDADLAEATIAKRVKTARQIFGKAVKWKLMAENPFEGLKAGSMSNKSRMQYVRKEDIYKVMAECPNLEWRLIIALSRFAGLRCPSETLALRWEDIDFDKRTMIIRSCKTEAYAGKDKRTMPIVPELYPILLEAFESAKDGADHVITGFAYTSKNLRTRMHQMIERAGLEAWPKPFHNLRSSCQIDLTNQFPQHVVCAWLGNSETVAKEHYLKPTDEQLARAAGLVSGDKAIRATTAA